MLQLTLNIDETWAKNVSAAIHCFHRTVKLSDAIIHVITFMF